VEQIDRCFGATRPGSYDKERSLFALHFRGLSFYFPVDLQYQPHYNHGLGSIRFPGDSSPLLSRMILYFGNNPSEAPVPPLPPASYKGMPEYPRLNGLFSNNLKYDLTDRQTDKATGGIALYWDMGCVI